MDAWMHEAITNLKHQITGKLQITMTKITNEKLL